MASAAPLRCGLVASGCALLLLGLHLMHGATTRLLVGCGVFLFVCFLFFFLPFSPSKAGRRNFPANEKGERRRQKSPGLAAAPGPAPRPHGVATRVAPRAAGSGAGIPVTNSK